MSSGRYSAYRVMWILVSFDLPTETKTERKAAARFRKELLNNGFSMFQFSVYIRHCASRENATVNVKRIREILPDYGKISVLQITDRQFGRMENYHGKKAVSEPQVLAQMELF